MMPVDHEPWSELEGFARCVPGPVAFRALAALLDTWAGEDRAAAIDRAAAMLSNWPDAVRLAPWSWCKAASRGAVTPSWPLVRALQLTSGHLSKGTVNLAQLAQHAPLDHVTELEIPPYSGFPELSFLFHRPDAFPALKKLRATDKQNDGDVRALAASPLWRTLESFEIDDHADSLAQRIDASRIVPRLDRPGRLRHLALRSPDLIALWDTAELPDLRSAAVIVRSIDEALALAARPELARLTSLSLAFRCGFRGTSSRDPFLGNVIEADEDAAEVFFSNARLNQLEELAIAGYRMGYWGREGLGRLGLTALIASGLLQRLRRLRLQWLPLGDQGVAALAPHLGTRLDALELVDVYCKGDGAAVLSDSPCLSSLRRLDLSGNRIDADRFARLASAPMPRLEELALSGPWINPYYWNVGQQPLLDAGAAAWAASTNARRLKHLRLDNCHLTDDGLSAIFRSLELRCLEVLDLSHNAFTAAAIAHSVVGSPLWQTLEALGLDHCRLDDAAIAALCRVDHASAIRSLRLGYNSISPAGAAALASWPVLARVWQLDLHDNAIGDQGLIALARSPYVGRLLELDLEQDCWNSRKFTFSDDAARALAASRSLPRLDALFSGCIDEYHQTAYSPGFRKDGLRALIKAEGMRPAFRASCSDFSGISEYVEGSGFNQKAELHDHDFRSRPYVLNEREAEPGQAAMQQLRLLPDAGAAIDDEEEPPAICPSLTEPEAIDEDVIEGLEFRDPKLSTDISLQLRLSLLDSERPLPSQVGKVLADTLRSLFVACAMGSFDVFTATSRKGEDGQYSYTDMTFSIRIKGDAEPAIQRIREALWWVRAPGDTDIDDFPLALTREPDLTTGGFLQLAAPKVSRWHLHGHDGHRIDRVPFTKGQRKRIRGILTEARAAESADGWASLLASDGGRMTICVKYLAGAPDFDTLSILIDEWTPETSGLVFKLMTECDLMAWPMALAATPEVAGAIDCDWPEVKVVRSAAALHQILARGPYHWWSRASDTPS